MKKNLLALTLIGSSMLLAGCSNVIEAPEDLKEPSEILEKDERHANLIPNRGTPLKAEDGGQFNFPDTVSIHYHRDDNSYADKKVWLWSKQGAPEQEFDLVAEEDPWSYVFTFSPEELFKVAGEDSFSFMIKIEGTWTGKSSEMPILYKVYEPQKMEDGTYHLDLYVTQTGSNLTVYKTKEDALSDQIDIAFISETYDKINIYTRDGTGNGESLIKDLKIYKFNEAFVSLAEDVQQSIKSDYLIFSAYNVNKDKCAVKFDKKLPVNAKYLVEATFVDKPKMPTTYTISFDNLYNTPEFNELNYTGDDLGATVSKDKKSTTFKVWAPTAYKMSLKLYDTSHDKSFLPKETYADKQVQSVHNTYVSYKMSLNLETALWEVTIPENLSGKYYVYNVTNSAGTNDVVDPYTKSAGVKGLRGMVVDFDDPKAKPAGWDDLPLKWDGTERDIKTPQELSVSEVHIRDLTSHETWGGDPKLAGTFNGFIQKGTTYTDGVDTVKTGYDHLVEYGVNAIQLLPVFDQDNGERGVEDVALDPEKPEELTRVTNYDTLAEYNWGYNPLNYNVVEGAYSSDPRDGYARVYEFRNLVEQFANNENQTRIIMDVVYNHVSSAPTSNFERLMPKYYFRFNDEGGYADASGCGNEVKTEAPMMRKFIVDSLVHWATNYKIKGFRFDLMGAIDTDTLSDVADALYEVDPDIVIYGEGWFAAKPTLPDNKLGTTGNLHATLGPNREGHHGFVGGFNDGGRDSLKGKHDSPNSGTWNGFILGNKGSLDASKKMMLGANDYSGSNNNPLQNIAYASCHDNYTLFDHLNWGLSDKKVAPDIRKTAQASVAVNGMVLMSNCISFIQGGEEIFRSKVEAKPYEEMNPQDKGYVFKMFDKYISHNSYKSPDPTNSYDYSRKLELYDYFKMYADLVKLKNNLTYSQEEVDLSTWSSGEAISIEEGNTSNVSLGVFRLGNNGKKYHAYLSTTAGAKFTCPGKVVFDTGNYNMISGGYETTVPQSLIIVEE